MNARVSFEGMSPEVVVHALYHGTKPLGPFGSRNDCPGLTIKDVQREIGQFYSASPYDFDDRGGYDIDWYRGRPLKIRLDLNTKTFDAELYDRDAGAGRAAEVIAALNTRIDHEPTVVAARNITGDGTIEDAVIITSNPLDRSRDPHGKPLRDESIIITLSGEDS